MSSCNVGRDLVNFPSTLVLSSSTYTETDGHATVARFQAITENTFLRVGFWFIEASVRGKIVFCECS